MQPSRIEVAAGCARSPLRGSGAVSVMDFQARDKATPESRAGTCTSCTSAATTSIDTWDLVDRAAPYVVGGYLSDKAREPLYVLARSAAWPERRHVHRGDLSSSDWQVEHVRDRDR